MTTQFIQSNLWERVTALAKKAKRKYVAVAYLGSGATKLLPLNRGDVLVVDMSLAAVRAAQTNPTEVEKYLKRGVEVHSCSNLHAKVFVFDKKAIVGSANVSRNSRDDFVEAALITTDVDAVSSARGFVIALMGERITPAYVKACKKEYHSSKRNRSQNGSKPAHPRFWVQRIYPLQTDDPQRDKASQLGWSLAQKKLKNKRLYEVEDISYHEENVLAQKAAVGDLIVQIWQEEDSHLRVYPPSRIVNIKPFISQRKARKKLIFVETPKSPKCLEWKVFRKALKSGGLSRVSEHIDREIINSDLKHKLLGLWQTWHDK